MPKKQTLGASFNNPNIQGNYPIPSIIIIMVLFYLFIQNYAVSKEIRKEEIILK